jgi:hypothetical protein
MRMLNMRCDVCGNAVRVVREDYDPPNAVERATNECDICNAASGGFEESSYFDADGNEVEPVDFYDEPTDPAGGKGSP